MVFESKFIRKGTVSLPAPSGTRIMMLPIVLGDLASVPPEYKDWHALLTALFDEAKAHEGRVGYLTIDEKTVEPNRTHRRAGLHVDGVLRGPIVQRHPKIETETKVQDSGGWFGLGGWAPPSGGGWGAVGLGMLTIASHVGCRAWNQRFSGMPGPDGECDHLADQCQPEACEVFEAGRLYWVDGLCVHESMPQRERVPRQFVRLSMPSEAPWFEGYTANPLGVMPTGPILPRRIYMDM